MKSSARHAVAFTLLTPVFVPKCWAAGAPPTPEFGVLALGLFVGGILGWGLVRAEGSLKAGLAVLGAALGGGPVLFIRAVGAARWAYPVGLVLGLLALYAYRSRGEWLDTRRGRGKRMLALVEVLLIVGITVAAAVYSAL